MTAIMLSLTFHDLISNKKGAFAEPICMLPFITLSVIEILTMHLWETPVRPSVRPSDKQC